VDAVRNVLEVSIDVDSDPISGSVGARSAAPRAFSGWIELAAAIETARTGGEILGCLPGANERKL